MDWFTKLEQDKVYTALSEDLQQCHNEIAKLKNKARALIRDINCLDVLEDLSLKTQWQEEDTTAEEDKVLENITGIDGESWFFKHNRGQELCQELMIAKCIEVANIKAMLNVVEERKDNVINERTRYRDEYQAKFNAKEEK